MISVIVPVYNVEMYLSKCIESILSQTYANFELILVDDGSTDNSYNICKNYALLDKRVKLLSQENAGPGAARNNGLIHAKGEFIVYVDSDDWIDKNLLQAMYTELIEKNVDLVICGHYMVTNNQNTLVKPSFESGQYNKSQLVECIYPKMINFNNFYDWGIFPGLFAKMYKKSMLEKHQLKVDETIKLGEDSACVFPLMLDINSLVIIDKGLYYYRQRPGSLVHENIDIMKKQLFLLYDFVKSELEKYQSISNIIQQWQEYMAFVLMAPRIETIYIDVDKLSFLFPYRQVKKGSKIVIYGMGVNGQLLIDYLNKNHFCEVVACVDRNYQELRKIGISVDNPEIIANLDFDAIVITPTFFKTSNQIYQYLSEKYDGSKIHLMDLELMKSHDVLNRLGLM